MFGRDPIGPVAMVLRSVRAHNALPDDAEVRLGHTGAMPDPFAIRRDPKGYSVVDVRTGGVVALGQAPQAGLSREDAAHTAELLNKRAAKQPQNRQTKRS